MAAVRAYIIAARRSAIGRVGGIHRHRRLEDLAAPIVTEALKDAGLSAARVDRLILGNVTAGGNPARVLALTAGLPESVACTSVDQQCASGLEAIVGAARSIALGECDVIVAGGAEAISMAPWRIARPRHVHQMPRFIDSLGGTSAGEDKAASGAEVGEALAKAHRISRAQQDEYALRSHMKAAIARDAKRFVKEIVALRNAAEEVRDQSVGELELEELADTPPLLSDGTLTPANTSAPHDGAAICVVVSEGIWQELGKPAALCLQGYAGVGLATAEAGGAAIAAMRRLAMRQKGMEIGAIGVVELSEASAAEAIAFRDVLGLADDVLSPDGGAIARGHPLGAASAVLVVRLFTRMVRLRSAASPKLGVAVLGTLDGQGAAASFEAV